MQRSQLPPHRSSTFVLRRWRAVYVSVNKAACTSLKWLVADLQGESPERFYGSLSREVGRAMTLHKRALWRRTPMLHRLRDEELASISPDDGWFVFAVVRHPTARVWSTWQSKLLLREPWWAEQFGDEPWFPRIPTSTGQIAEDFGRFVEAIAANPDHPIMSNRHLVSQTRMLVPDRMPYSRIYKTNEMPQLLEDLESHLRMQGWDGTLNVPRSNETPLPPLASFFTEPVVEAMQRLYGDDFATFGYDDPLPDGLDGVQGYRDGALAEIGRLVERAERINDLVLRARAAEERAAAATARAEEAEERTIDAYAHRAQLRIRRRLKIRRRLGLR